MQGQDNAMLNKKVLLERGHPELGRFILQHIMESDRSTVNTLTQMGTLYTNTKPHSSFQKPSITIYSMLKACGKRCC